MAGLGWAQRKSHVLDGVHLANTTEPSMCRQRRWSVMSDYCDQLFLIVLVIYLHTGCYHHNDLQMAIFQLT